MLNKSNKTIVYFAHITTGTSIHDRIKRIKPNDELPDFYDWLVKMREDTGGIIVNCNIIKY